MAITQIIGKSGQGKTLFQSKLLLKEIQTSNRPILSNLPMDFSFRKSWIFDIIRIPNKVHDFLVKFPIVYKALRAYTFLFDSNQRITTYNQIEVCYDYAKMVQWSNILDQTAYEKQVRALVAQRLEIVDDVKGEAVFTDIQALAHYPFDKRVLQNGFVWVIDELASYFSARDYKNTPPQFLQLLTQHRKMRIDLIGTTQRYTSIDVWFRELAHNVFLVKKWAWFPRLHRVYAI